jgi:hypothetical protein
MRPLLERIGAIGLLALALIAAAALVQGVVLEPLETELRSLEGAARHAREPAAMVRVSAAGSQMHAFYRYFERPVQAHEWLAKLYAIGRASGVELPNADYRVQPTGTRLVRYQLSLPVTATYAQARAFMANALNEVPVLSIDQANFRRVRANDPRLDVEIVMTLHLLEP